MTGDSLLFLLPFSHSFPIVKSVKVVCEEHYKADDHRQVGYTFTVVGEIKGYYSIENGKNYSQDLPQNVTLCHENKGGYAYKRGDKSEIILVLRQDERQSDYEH